MVSSVYVVKQFGVRRYVKHTEYFILEYICDWAYEINVLK